MPALVYNRGVGQYRTSEVHNLICSRMYAKNTQRRGIVYCHANNLTGDDQIRTGNNADKIMGLAAAGYPVLSTDLGGLATWGNDTAQAAIDDAFAFLISEFGANPGAVGLYGVSMGALAALNWAQSNLDKVYAIALGVPALDLEDLHGQATFEAGIDTAYTNHAGYLAALATHSPVVYGSSVFGRLPIGIWSSDTDIVASNTSDCRTWAGNASVQVNSIGSYTHGTAVPQIPAAGVVDWFDRNGGYG